MQASSAVAAAAVLGADRLAAKTLGLPIGLQLYSVRALLPKDFDGTLKAVQHVSCGGKTPRHFALDPGNQWLLVANQDSSNIVVFARNPRSGLLTPTGNQYPLSFPVCLVFH